MTLLKQRLQSRGRPRMPKLLSGSLKSAVLAIAAKFDVADRVPPEIDLADMQRRVSEAWHDKKALTGIERRVGKWVPWFLFEPCAPLTIALGADKEFGKEYVRWARRNRPALFRLVVHVLLRDYPTQLGTFDGWRRATLRALDDFESVRLAAIRERVQKYDLLGKSGPRRVGEVLADLDRDLPSVWEEVGLTGELRFGEFAAHAVREALQEIEASLDHGDATLSHVSRARDLVVLPDGKPYRRDLRVPLADALLAPFEGKSPAEGIRREIIKVLLRQLGSPSLHPDNWKVVSPKATAVMKRWLIDRDLAVFFAIVQRLAKESHWKYRQRFWQAYHDHGLLDEVWLVLSRRAMVALRGQDRDVAAACGVFDDNASADKSAILMRIGQLTIVEWSHDGRCRIWDQSSSTQAPPPQLGMRRYARDALMVRARHEVAHMNSDRGYWQARVAQVIRSETGARISAGDYL